MNVTTFEIPGLVLLEPKAFADARGSFMETYHARRYAEAGIIRPFVQDNLSHSSERGILRGLHSQVQHPQGKLVYVVRGEIWDVAVDVRRGSPTFGKWAAATLSAENRQQLFVPEGCLHGYVVMSEGADVIYKCTDFYAPNDELGVIWNDPAFNIPWPVTAPPKLSPKDEKLALFSSADPGRLSAFEG